MTALQRQTHSQVQHLTADDVEQIGRELDLIRQDVLDTRGARDAAYIRRVIAVQRRLELASRVILLAGRFPPAWVAGTAALSLAKILDNMEIGHNVLHGQWDWMRDPTIHSSTWDWDHASPPAQWKRAHNETHHTYTNILGQDNDLGYGIMRVDEDQEWQPRYLVQPLWNFFNACIFEYGIAMYDIEFGEHLREGKGITPELRSRIREAAAKASKGITKDYVLHPMLAGPGGWFATLTANATANFVRNVWSHSIIMCGHFPEGVETFEQGELPQNETRGEWYLRQMLGSANISGPPLMHLMSGNLSHQIEHHLFPDLPSNRYSEIAPRVRQLFERYGLSYNARPLPQQVASAWHRVFRLSLPNDWLAETNRRNVPAQLKSLWRQSRRSRGAVGPGLRRALALA
ncbi:putative fatty acid desaturase [Nocardioides szechwanensis]|uniref:Linoleoyl-CoA desaturase n=1 Tax=Nocardioides szechwanensis TaxID=1005944 RepID=A0A1H0KMM5_9ACTN|nr:acyl-CoA desaturase [Nocardioides szechwanensis]GEP35468.1 putative fatty acid desaturase [Nocardioides szechwanensis]SDO57179.1 linoleoyl-CoA desaturase [Nocardioides szechwanensis]